MKKIIVSPLCTASICLSVTLLAAGLAAQIAAALVPNIILPALDIPTLAALSLLALVLEVILFGENHRFWATSLIVGTVAFGVLSLCAGSVPTVLDALRVGILGGAVFLICEVLLTPSWTGSPPVPRASTPGAWLWCPRCCCGLLHRF